ncbi:MAG: hypothetical protein NC489_30415 [Ruminococcus flavefaciens]|nr:hypothetical protein [Ruminococcus flavefaciens]
MEHLTRNTRTDRLIYTIESLKTTNQSEVLQEMHSLSKDIVNVWIGILSSVLSSVITFIITKYVEKGMLSKEGITENISTLFIIAMCSIGLFVIAWLGIWWLCSKCIVPSIYGLFHTEYVDITAPNEIEYIKQFHTDIVQKVSEIAEVVKVMEDTTITECIWLNFILSLYKLQEVVSFLYNMLVKDAVPIRNTSESGCIEIIYYELNFYTISAVIKTVMHVRDNMKKLINNDELKLLNGYQLMKNDLNDISNQLDEIIKIRKEINTER